MGGPNPYAVELVDEQSCRWNEGDVPLSDRGVRFSWLCNFVRGIYWQLEQPVQEQSRLRDELRAWEHHKEHSWIYSDQPTPDHLKGATLSGPELKFDGLTIHELVGQHIVPLTAAIHAPLYARVPPSDRGKPGVFLSHAWANHVLSPVPQWGGGTLNAFDSQGIAGIKEEFVWIDFVCYNQHTVANDSIAFDMEAIIRSIGNVAFAVTMTPLFDRIWCLWEVLSASQVGAETRFCVYPGFRTDKRVMVNNFFRAFTSIREARATKTGDYEKLLAAMISRFGSSDAADEYIRELMLAGMGDRWFEVYSENQRRAAETQQRRTAEAESTQRAEEGRQCQPAAIPVEVGPPGGSHVRLLIPGAGKTEWFKDLDIGPEMVVVPAGSFVMGSPVFEEGRIIDEGPQPKVTLAKPFAVGRFAVTFDEWDACVADGGCNGYKPKDRDWGRGSRPVIYISWKDANAYVEWLSRKTGRTYRLLTEAEWEYVARAGTTTPFWCGNSISTDQANYNGHYIYGKGAKGEYRARTSSVNSFEPNTWGLYQVHGNVWEWTDDCYNHRYNGAPTDGSVWTSGDCSRHIVRGGCWNDRPVGLRAAYRYAFTTDDRNSDLGFRVARTLLAP